MKVLEIMLLERVPRVSPHTFACRSVPVSRFADVPWPSAVWKLDSSSFLEGLGLWVGVPTHDTGCLRCKSCQAMSFRSTGDKTSGRENNFSWVMRLVQTAAREALVMGLPH